MQRETSHGDDDIARRLLPATGDFPREGLGLTYYWRRFRHHAQELSCLRRVDPSEGGCFSAKVASHMPKYYLHLHNTHVDASDEEGHDFPNLEAAKAKATAGIQGFLGHEAMSGKLDFRGRVDILNESGEVVDTVHFKDALTIIGW
jgi:hypothetical protein